MQIELNEQECRLLIDLLGDVCAAYKREAVRATRRMHSEQSAREVSSVAVDRHYRLTGILRIIKSALASMRALERAKAKNGGNDE